MNRFFGFFSFLLLTVSGYSQIPAAVQQSENVQRQQSLQTPLIQSSIGDTAPELYPGENKDVGPQFLLKAKPRQEWIEASVDSQYFYTSNVFLAQTHAVDTGLLVNTAQFAFAPTPFDLDGGKIAPRLGFRQQWYNYGLDNTKNQLNNNDFDVQTIFAEARYQFEDYWIAGLGTDFTRLLSHEPPAADYSETYKEVAPRGNLTRIFPLNPTMMFSAAYDTEFHITHTPPFPGVLSYVNNRWDNSFTGTFSWQAYSGLIVQPYYRIQYTDYTDNISRNDFLHTLGLSVNYSFSNWGSVRSFVSYDVMDSYTQPHNLAVDYHNLNAGLGVSLVLHY